MNGSHRPCLSLLCVLVLGIVIGNLLPLSVRFWLWVSVLVVVVSFFWPRNWLLFVSLFCLGAALIHVAHPPDIDALSDWRETLQTSLYNYLDDDEAGSISAIVLGDRSNIPKEINQIFRRTGTGHILVIAGLHMAMMIGIILFVLKIIRIPYLLQLWLSVFLVFGYALLTGGSIPVMRAAFMASVMISSFAVEREGDSLNSLCLAALILLLGNAHHLYDVSFQLSFGAVFGIILLYKPIEQLVEFLPKWLAGAIAVSTSAWIGIAPFQFWHFGSFTPIALIANLIIVPLLDITVALGISLSLCGLWFPAMAWGIAGSLKFVFNLMVVIAFWLTKIPYGYIQFWTVAYHRHPI